MFLQLVQGQTGKQTGGNIAAASGEFSEQLATELMARYYQNTYRGNKFALTFAAAALAAASASAAGAFLLVNPLGSGKNLVLIDIMPGVTAFTPVATGTSVMLGGLPNAVLTVLGTPVVPVSTLIGSGAKSVASGYPSATIAITPASIRQLANLYADLAAGDFVAVKDEIAGAVVIQPGSAVNIFGLGGTPGDYTLQPTITWDEIPV